jgi:transcriptional regulator with XRE-family HTH domain
MAYRYRLNIVHVCGMPAKLDKTDLKLRRAIAERFKEIREASGSKQKDFACSYGRDKQSYNKNETGKGATIYTINKFCIENEITLTEFFNSELFTTKKSSKN